MSTDITQSFVRQYESEVHEAYQRRQSHLLMTVRRKPNVIGESTTFQVIGKGVATTKSRHGLVTPMNITHTPVTVTLVDFYAGDYVDRLDELKINHDERRVQANAGAWSLARKSDEQIVVNALDSAAVSVAAAATGVTKAKIKTAMQNLGDADVFEAGRMWAVVGFDGWMDLMDIDEFKNADFIGTSDLPWLDGTEAKRWFGATWFPSASINDADSGSTKNLFIYHEDALGYAWGQQVAVDINWIPERVAHFVNHFMSGNAVLIDSVGVQKVQYV